MYGWGRWQARLGRSGLSCALSRLACPLTRFDCTISILPNDCALAFPMPPDPSRVCPQAVSSRVVSHGV